MSEKPTSELLKICAACGAEARREAANFCAVCGKTLNSDYSPLDSLLASYNLQRREEEQKSNSPAKIEQEPKSLFVKERNGASSMAMAFVVYSLVPYLGILFCPGALVMGGIGLATSYQKPQLGGRQTAGLSILLGTIVTAIQILLWWLLYLIPEFNRF